MTNHKHQTSNRRHRKMPLLMINAVLDLVITSEPDMVDELLVVEGLGASDHSMLLWTCQFGKKKRLPERIKLNYRKANLDKIKNTLSSTDWDRLLDGKCHEGVISIVTVRVL